MKIFRTAALTGLGLLTLVATSNLAAAVVAGFATSTVNERAGPGTEYPIVNVIPAGAEVTIYGCLSGWSCDVDFAGWRGWVFGEYLQAYYQSAPVAIPYYGPTLGIPFVAFSVNYWDNHYRARPWYGQRDNYFRIPGRPGTFKPKGGGAYTYYPPGEGRYVGPKPGWRPAPGYRPGSGNRPGPKYGIKPYKPAYNQGYVQPKPQRIYKGPRKQPGYAARPGPAYAPKGGQGAYVYDPGPQPGGKKKCPLRNGKPYCKPIRN
jgi:uncharacterized protein YraI